MRRLQKHADYRSCSAFTSRRIIGNNKVTVVLDGSRMNKERISKLEAQVKTLQDLLIRAYAKFLFWRPMMVNESLNQTISSEEKGACFDQLRNWLYWDFILELVKLCDDSDERTPSIRQLKEELADAETLRDLREKYTRRSWGPLKGLDERTAQYLQKQEQEEMRSEFDEIHRRFQLMSNDMLASSELIGYQTIRDKLIAHNELRKTEVGYVFFDINVLYLKFGQERKLLETARTIIDDLDSLVRNHSFDWNSLFQIETKDVCKFWEIPSIEGF